MINIQNICNKKKTTYHQHKQMQNVVQEINKHNQITLKSGIL
jgi:hypothetical protein